MVRAVQTLAYDTAICGNHYKERMSRDPKESSSCKDFYLGGILFKLRHFAGGNINLLVGNGIELFIVIMHELTR